MTEPDPGSPAGPQQGPDAVELLVRAVSQLDPAQRNQVFAWLLRRDAVTSSPAEPFLMAPAGTARRHPWALNPDLPIMGPQASFQAAPTSADVFKGLHAAPPSAQQMVPVRFSTEQHAQLREWCAEHGFSMATVIRGLVARFLEGQLPRPA
jgi:hypothetical protein